jgi:hypothetical protein
MVSVKHNPTKVGKETEFLPGTNGNGAVAVANKQWD